MIICQHNPVHHPQKSAGHQEDEGEDGEEVAELVDELGDDLIKEDSGKRKTNIHKGKYIKLIISSK